MGKKLKVALGSDHAGYPLKESLKEDLKEFGLEVIDFGTNSIDSVDYPDYAKKVASGVAEGKYDKGVLVCATGIGMSIAANRFDNVRAALVTSDLQAEMASKHNNANILVFGGRITSPKEAKEMLKIWLDTVYEGGRHDRRISKIGTIKE